MRQLRRTMLYIPGNNPSMIRDAGIYDADSLMFDLEDSIAPQEKDSARFLVREALASLEFPGKELIVRVNSPESGFGADDIEAIVDDLDGLRREAELIKRMGFDGKSVINPRQVEVIHDVFAPKPAEIDNAVEIMAAIDEAEKNGLGVISLNGKMIDKPIVERARHVVDIARAMGVIQ